MGGLVPVACHSYCFCALLERFNLWYIHYIEKTNKQAKTEIYFRYLCCSSVKDLILILHNNKSSNKVWIFNFFKIQYYISDLYELHIENNQLFFTWANNNSDITRASVTGSRNIFFLIWRMFVAFKRVCKTPNLLLHANNYNADWKVNKRSFVVMIVVFLLSTGIWNCFFITLETNLKKILYVIACIFTVWQFAVNLIV